jgi:hypothetical protein
MFYGRSRTLCLRPAVVGLTYPRSCRQRSSAVERARRTGAALVEFACVAPIMILFTIGLIEMGRMTMVKQLLTNISREGSRLATLPGASSDGVRSQVEALLSGSHIRGATVTLSPELLSSASAGNLVTVSIAVESEKVSWLPTPIFMAGKSISAATSMRRESL